MKACLDRAKKLDPQIIRTWEHIKVNLSLFHARDKSEIVSGTGFESPSVNPSK